MDDWLHDETTYARVETPLEFLVSSVLLWFYGPASVPSSPHSSVLERQAMRMTVRPPIHPKSPPAPPIRDNVLDGAAFESSKWIWFTAGITAVIALLLLWKVIEYGYRCTSEWWRQRECTTDRKPVGQNAEADVRTFCRGMDVDDWLKTLDRHIERRSIVNDADKVEVLLEKTEQAIRRQLRAMVDVKSQMNYPALRELLQECQEKQHLNSNGHRERFEQRRQANGENVYAFYMALAEIADLAYPQMSKPQRDEIVKGQFVRGLANETTRTFICNWLPMRWREQT